MDSKLGRRHPAVQRLRALRRNAKLRREEGVFVAEGLHLAQEALASGADVEQVLYSKRLRLQPEGRALLKRMAARKLQGSEVGDSVLDSIQDVRSPQPVLMVVRRSALLLDECLRSPGDRPLFVVADGIQDPGNLGSMLRTADAAGAAGFVATGDGADLYHPRTVRGTMGSIFRVPAVATELEAALKAFRQAGLPTVATVPPSVIASTVVSRADLGGGCVVLFGGEGAGLPDAVVAAADTRVSIPMREGVDSLSVGAAAAVVLFEAARQRDDA